MHHARRDSVLLLIAIGLLAFACQPAQLHVVNYVLVTRNQNYGGTYDQLVYKADLRNDSTSDVSAAWAQVTGGVPAGATIQDAILRFGPTPASSSSQSTDAFIVLVAPGAAFDPTVLSWSVVRGAADQDQDGITDADELDYSIGTDPANPDTDGDRFGDGIEGDVMGTDPNSVDSKPTSFFDGLFYSSSPRPSGKTAIAVAGSPYALPDQLLLVGPDSVGPVGLAFDRHGFLYGVRGGDIAHFDALTGQLLGDAPLHDSLGNPVRATELAYDPTTDTFIAVKNDPTTGVPTTQPLQVDLQTGLATELNAWLPGTPRAITILPQIDSQQRQRWLYAVIDESSGTEQIYKVDLDTSAATPVGAPFTGPVTGLAFDQHLNLVQALVLGSGQTMLTGGSAYYGPADAPLHGLAIPQACPAPCFGPPTFLGASPASIAVGDIDGDGDLDFVTAESSPAGLHPYLNDGTGTMVAQPLEPSPDDLAIVRLTDFDGDGHLDAVLGGDSGQILVAHGRGDGTFDPPVSLWSNAGAPVVADYNGDGYPDIVATDGTLLNDGTGTFMPQGAYPFGRPSDVAVAKLDNGPVPEVVAVYGYSAVDAQAVATFVWKGPLTGFVETSRQTLDFGGMSLAVGDFDGDGFDDVVVTGQEPGTGKGVAVTLRAVGDGTLAAPVRLSGVPDFVSARNPLVADVTGDGRPDIVLGSADPQYGARVMVGDGAGHFQPAIFDVPVPGDFTAEFAAADLDGNGLPDLIGTFDLVIVHSLPPYPVK